MELWDILDENGNKTGATVERSKWDTLQENEYILVVDIYIRNHLDQWLIQKRSPTKELAPNIWSITGGAAFSGEDSLTAALREVKEEIGIDLDAGKMHVAGRIKRKGSLGDIWIADASFELCDCILQPEEVSEVKWVTSKALVKLVMDSDYRNDEYKAIIEKLIDQSFII